MISIAEAISDLLFVRDTVVVPGLGAFVKKPVSAKVNPVANYFAMPSSEVVFDANLREDNELVVNYMSEKNDIPREEAQKLLSMFVSDCFNSLKQRKKVVLNQIGTLAYDWADDFVFEQDKSINYNADAFGLCDFTLPLVLCSKSKEDIKMEIEQQQKDKNTPITVDEKAVHELVKEDGEARHGLGWLWGLLGFLLVAGIVYGLYYFEILKFPWQREERSPVYERKIYTLPVYVKKWEWKEIDIQDTIQVLNDSAEHHVEQPTERLVVIDVDAHIRIIAGCFGQEENASRLANTLKEKGYGGALYEKRGKMWYVSFGCYRTDDEASAALREIRSDTDYKAWILK